MNVKMKKAAIKLKWQFLSKILGALHGAGTSVSKKLLAGIEDLN